MFSYRKDKVVDIILNNTVRIYYTPRVKPEVSKLQLVSLIILIYHTIYCNCDVIG